MAWKVTVFLLSIITMVILTSWNCNGLCDVNKMKMVFSLFQEKRFDIIGLQETHWKDDFIEKYKHLWNGDIYYDNFQTASKGVTFLIRNDI